MDILSKSDDEIYELAKPIWDNLVKSSNLKQTNKEIPGEFLGRLVLGVEDDTIKVFGATIY